VISEELWRNHFHSTPDILGKEFRLNQRVYKVVGVAPASFPGRLRGAGIWIPFTMQSDFYAGRDFFKESETPWLIVEGRLRTGVSKSEAEAELSKIARAKAHATVIVTNGSFAQHPAVRSMMLGTVPLIMGAMTLVLLLACSNATLLLLSRAAARRQEIAVRRALGADRTRLLRLLLTEGLLLAILAGGAAAVLAAGIPAAFRWLLWRAPYYPVKPDWLFFAYLAGSRWWLDVWRVSARRLNRSVPICRRP